MVIDDFSGPDVDRPIVAADTLSACQWEAHLAAGEQNAVWSARAIAYRHWTRELWSADGGESDRAGLLSSRQSAALWQRVVAESAEGDGLLGVTGTAAWAEDAWRRIHGWRLDDTLRPASAHEHDYAAFLRWRRDYGDRLRDARWIDEALLDAHLTRTAQELRPRSVDLADLDDLSPSRQLLTDRLMASGWTVGRRRSPTAARHRALRCPCAEPRDELRSAAAWARGVLERESFARVAIVVPGLERRAPEVRRALAEALTDAARSSIPQPLYLAAGDHNVNAQPLVGAAVNALELMSPQGALPDFGRWLRSPFFHAIEPAMLALLARIEVALRTTVDAQLPFVDAYRRCGLRERVRADAPDVAARLDDALLELDRAPAWQSPAAWARLWSRLLQCLGWRGWRPTHAVRFDDFEQRHWEAALRDFAMLTPILGALSHGRALAELAASLRRTTPDEPAPLRGVHVLSDIGSLGPGYSGAWITGVTDSALPVSTTLNPLLPRRLQVDCGMPWSSPEDALRRSQALVDEAARRVPQCIFSWPARDRDEEHEPSPLIHGLADTDTARDGPLSRARSARPSRSVQTTNGARIESLPDAAPPLAAAEIRGGTAALNAHSASPLRAFCEFRLGAKALEPFARGVPARLRGVATHAALERFFRIYGSRERLAFASGAERRRCATRCAESALTDLFGAARTQLVALFELERDRLTTAIDMLADKEIERADYRVERLEHRHLLTLCGRVLALRIDRVDALGNGGLAVIDYKTGRSLPTSSWLWPRPRDVQLPAYALALPDVSALAVATLRSDDVRYAGIWPKGAFPGRQTGNGATVEQLVETWRLSVGALVDEYCAGDTRFFADDPDPVSGAFAPLTRVYEMLALHRGRKARLVA